MGVRERVDLVRRNDLTLGSFLNRMATVRGDTLLVEEAGDDPLHLTYSDAADLVGRLAHGIRDRISPGDRVVINAPNGYGLFLLSLAACAAGGIAVPVNPHMRDEEVAHV